MLDWMVKEVMREEAAVMLPPETCVESAAEQMAERGTGAVMVVADGSLVGIFTERDAVYRVLARQRDAKRTALGEVMTPAPRAGFPDMRYGAALAIMQECGFRHLPILDHGRPVGIVSSRNAMDPQLEEFISESHRREHYLRHSRHQAMPRNRDT